MSVRHLSILVLFLACVASVHAVRPAPATPEPAKKDEKASVPASNEPVPPYVLKKRSAFSCAPETTRAPFWPIGWVKRKAGQVAAAPQVQVPKVLLDAKSFKLTSILVGSGTTPSLAVINGRAYSEGEFLRVPKAAATAALRVRVQRINDGMVILQNAEQTLVVQLQRPELSARKPEELLNDQDR